MAASSALLHPEIAYGSEFQKASAGVSWGWLGISGLGIVMSTVMNFLGLKVVFPDRTWAACLMALMLAGFVMGIGVLISRATRRARSWLVAMALLFGGNR